MKNNRRGNPNWGKPLLDSGVIHGVLATEFEILCMHLRLFTFKEMVASVRLKDWVIKNANKRYVPEKLLKAYGIDIAFDDYSGYI